MENFEKLDGIPETNEEQDSVVSEEVVEEVTTEEPAVEEIPAEAEEIVEDAVEEAPADEISEEAVEDAPADEDAEEISEEADGEIVADEPKKESKALFISMVAVVSLVVVLILYFLFFGGLVKKSLTAEEFTKLSEGMDLTVTDYSQDASVDTEQTDAFIAAENLDMYLQFWDFKDESTAKTLFAGILPGFREASVKKSESSGINFESGKYYGENGEYIYIIRIGDVIVSGESLSPETEPVDIAMKKLGY